MHLNIFMVAADFQVFHGWCMSTSPVPCSHKSPHRITPPASPIILSLFVLTGLVGRNPLLISNIKLLLQLLIKIVLIQRRVLCLELLLLLSSGNKKLLYFVLCLIKRSAGDLSDGVGFMLHFCTFWQTSPPFCDWRNCTACGYAAAKPSRDFQVCVNHTKQKHLFFQSVMFGAITMHPNTTIIIPCQTKGHSSSKPCVLPQPRRKQKYGESSFASRDLPPFQKPATQALSGGHTLSVSIKEPCTRSSTFQLHRQHWLHLMLSSFCIRGSSKRVSAVHLLHTAPQFPCHQSAEEEHCQRALWQRGHVVWWWRLTTKYLMTKLWQQPSLRLFVTL